MDAERKIKVPTTGTYDFPSLIQDGEGKYVDKTDLLYELASPKTDAQLFIARPRRFGKSLMLSTLKAMFEGRRDLFKGLAIDSLPWEGWVQPTPVYSFTMANANGMDFREVEAALSGMVEGMCSSVDLKYDEGKGVAYNFDLFIKAASEKSPTKKIVVLIDEYDEPVAKFLDDLPTLNKVRSVFHDFYEKLKINSGSIRFLLMTGVTKLTKLSVFSGMNHLTDVSSFPQYATLLGYTPEELDGSLRENVEAFGERNGLDFETAKNELLRWYDGYRFSPDSERRVCNPVSLGSAFKVGKLKGFWEMTGRATLIINRIAKAGKMPQDIENVRAKPMTLDVCDAETLPMASLLYQGGYLTIKDVIPPPVDENGRINEEPTYVLAPPNHEVREALKDGYISQILGLEKDAAMTALERAKRQIVACDWKGFLCESLFSLYASVPPDWRIKDEAEAKRYFQMFASMCGANPQPEFATMMGYADAVIETPKEVCVFEFKYRKSAKAAIKQIRERDYAAKWANGPRPVTLVGINFNPKKRNIDMPIIEPL